MQSRLAIAASRSGSAILSARSQTLSQRFASTGRTADPAIHSEQSQDVGKVAEEPEPAQARERESNGKTVTRSKQSTTPFSPPKLPHAQTPRLENPGVSLPVDSYTQQKRASGTAMAHLIENVSCAGLDGTPLPKQEEKESEKVEEEREYYKHHKASPLSEIKIADTRKPITRATDGTAASAEYGAGKDVIGWLPEQLDTAEEALRRATEIWKHNAMRGDPETFPHSRILRELRGEWF